MIGRSCLAVLGLALGLAAASEPSSEALTAAPPPASELLRRVLEQPANHSTNEHLLDARYRYVRSRTLDVRAGDGDLIRRDETRLDHRPGAAAGTGEDSIVRTDAKGTKGRAYQRTDFAIEEALFARFAFTPAGCDVVAGRPAWVLDFEPASELPPAKDLKDRFLNRIAGRLWIDTEEAVVVRATIRLLSPVGVLGGLVGSVKRCEVLLERERTSAGDWYARRFAWQLEGRKLFARRLMHFHEERTNVALDPTTTTSQHQPAPR